MPLKVVKHPNSPNLYLRGTVRGQYVFETTGTPCKEAAEEIRAKREGELIAQSIHGKRVTATFDQAALKYLDNGGDARFVGHYDSDHGWGGLIGHFYGRRMSSIHQDDLDQAAKALHPRATPQTRNRQVYTPFVAIWNRAVADGLAEPRTWRRPSEKKGTAKAPRKLRRGTHAVSYERARDFVLALSPAPAIVMTVLFYTGLRPIEAFALAPDDVIVEGRWIIVRSSKTGEARGVPMHRFLVPLMQALKATAKARGLDRMLFNRKGRPYPMTEDGGGQMKSAIISAARRSGIADVSPYTARHTVSTQLVVNDIHPYVKDQILGHAVTDMSRRYTHVPQAPLIEAIDTLPVPEGWSEAPWFINPEWAIGRLPSRRKSEKIRSPVAGDAV